MSQPFHSSLEQPHSIRTGPLRVEGVGKQSRRFGTELPFHRMSWACSRISASLGSAIRGQQRRKKAEKKKGSELDWKFQFNLFPVFFFFFFFWFQCSLSLDVERTRDASFISIYLSIHVSVYIVWFQTALTLGGWQGTPLMNADLTLALNSALQSLTVRPNQSLPSASIT